MFGIINHDILFNHREKLVGVSDGLLNWLKTYITGRNVSEKHYICDGVIVTIQATTWWNLRMYNGCFLFMRMTHNCLLRLSQKMLQL